MTYYGEDEILMLSGIQHFVFCQRQWALIHLENQWCENLKTTDGKLAHEKCHDENIKESRKGLLVVRGLRFSSSNLGVNGQCDVVEFFRRDDDNGAVLHGKRGTWDVYPVEYKLGKPKEGLEDVYQLCGQALCLEEMFGYKIDKGYLYYDSIRRRLEVKFTDELRHGVIDTLTKMHAYYRRGFTPKVKPTARCRSCSLKDLCLPRLCKKISVADYYNKYLEE